MLYLYLIAAYVLSVVVTVLTARWAVKVDNTATVDWYDVLLTLLPGVNLICVVYEFVVYFRDHPIPLPKWIVRLYGGRWSE